MAEVTIEQVAVLFGADTDNFKKGLKNAEASAKTAKTNILKYLAPIAGIFATGKLFGGFLQADEIGKFAASVGESVTDIDSWQEAVKHAGGSAEGFRSTISNLSRGLAEVATTGKGRAKTALDSLGVSATDAGGKVRKASDVLLELSTRAESLDKAEFLGIATRLGIDQGTIRLLQSGNKSIKEQLEILRTRALTEEDASVSADFNDAIQDLKKSFQGVANILLRAVTPIITKFSEKLTKVTDYLIENKPVLLAVFVALAAVIGTKVVLAIKSATLAARGLALAFAANPAVLIIGAIIAVVIILILFVEDLWNWITGGESVLGDLLGDFDSFSEGVIDFFRSIGEFFFKLLSRMRLRVANFFKNIVTLARNAVSLLPDFLLPDGVSKWLAEVDTNLQNQIIQYEQDAGLIPIQNAQKNSVQQTEINTDINKVEIITQATDSDEIAKNFKDGVEKYFGLNASRQAASVNRSM